MRSIFFVLLRFLLLFYIAIFTENIILVLAALTVLISLPYAVMLAKRVLFARRLAHLCRKRGYVLGTTSPLWFLSGLGSRRPAFYVETPFAVYSVKLFGTPFKHHFYNFIDAGHCLVCNVAPTMGFLIHTPPIRRTRPPCDFGYFRRESWSGKRFEPVLLMHPVSATVASGCRVIGNGDFIHEGRFYTKSAFLKLLDAAA